MARKRTNILWVLFLCIGTFIFVKWNLRRISKPVVQQPAIVRVSDKKPGAAQPAPESPVASEPGKLRVSDDAESKGADFWLEQSFSIADPAAARGKELLDLYVSLDLQTLGGVRVRLKDDELLIEELVQTAKPAADPRAVVLGRAPLSARSAEKGEQTLGLLWRKGELSAWLGPKQILQWSAPGTRGAMLRGPSGVQVLGSGLRMGLKRTVALSNIRFDDTFMRDTAGEIWRPVLGKWELTALAFPERSANPFSLRANGLTTPAEDSLYKGRLRENEDFGIGVVLSIWEGTMHIERITGGSPAAKAGLAEDDIFVEVDGHVVANLSPRHVYELITSGYGAQLRLKMYRPGEKTLRDYVLTREQFRWGMPAEAIVIPGSGRERTPTSLIVAGESGWSDYAAEVAIKPLGSGGAGLAVAVTSDQDFVLFRWRGPQGPRASMPVRETETNKEALQLVQVVGGKETVLAEKLARYRPYEFYRMGVDWNGDKISCSIDGVEVLSAAVPGIKRGKIGLYAMAGETVFFDDVRITSDRTVLRAANLPDRQINDIFAAENAMEVWANPALEWARDLKTGWAIHQARFPGKQIVVLNKPRFSELEVRLGCASDGSLGNGPQLIIAGGVAKIAGPSIKPAQAAVGKGPFGRIAFHNTEVDIDGTRIAIETEKNAPAALRTHDRVAIRGLKNLGDPATVRVNSAGTLEYTFDTSPADWKVESGRWGLLNKWICDPRWSWFGGRTKTVAALWNKHIFSGDVSVDAHVALMMQKEDPPYERPGDYNISICGDGVNLDSGYTLIFAGDNNSWTRLYRKGKLVAESTKEEHRLFSDRVKHPDKPELHQRWFHLKLEKIGNAISFYRDGALAFAFIDADPLGDGRVGFWTLDNGFMLSRLRIAHNGMQPAPFESRLAKPFSDERVINLFDGEALTAVEPVALPPAIQASLSSPAEAFVPAAADFAAAPAAEIYNGTPAYNVVNGTGGGPFALQWKALRFNPDDSVLRLAYCINPGAKVDLYLYELPGTGRQLDPRYQRAFRWRMSGPAESTEFAPLVGDIPGVVADGRWHTVQFDLQPSWREYWRGRGERPMVLTMRLMFGNLDNSGYLLAGMNGNACGASYSVSDPIKFTPREIDRAAPTVKRVIWPGDAEGDGHSLQIVFDDAGGSGILEESLQVVLNNEISVAREINEFNARTQTLRVDLLHLNKPLLANGSTLSLKLMGYQDRAQNPGALFTANFAVDYAKLKVPPITPAVWIVSGDDAGALPGRVPQTLSDVTSAGEQGARIEESNDAPPWAAAGHKRSIHVVNMTDGSAMGLSLNSVHYNLRNYPYILLDYKIPQETPANLHIQDENGATHALILTDIGDALDPLSGEISSRAGPPPDFIADGTWRRSIIPIKQLFASAQMPGTDPRMQRRGFFPGAWSNVGGLALFDNGWKGTRRDMQYWIHRMQPLPAGPADKLKVDWWTADLTGIVDFETSIDEQPFADPAGKKDVNYQETLGEALKRRNATLADGWHYLHLRLKNGTGQWSATAHAPFYLDGTAPKIARTIPAEGEKHAGRTIKIVFDEAHGVELQNLRLKVNGALIMAGARGMQFDPATNTLTYNGMLEPAWQDGTKVRVEVAGLSDSLGNRSDQTQSFTFIADKSIDTQGPAIAHMRFLPGWTNPTMHRQIDMESSFAVNFEEHVGHVHAMRDCSMEWLDDPAQSCFGRRAARFTVLDDDADVQIMLHKNPWHLDTKPMFDFDFKVDAGVRVDLLVEVMGQWLSVGFTGDGLAPQGGLNIGKLDGVRADGKWHHASFDLQKMIRRSLPDLPIDIATRVMLSAQGREGCKRGATLCIDNVDLFGQNAPGKVEWDATDPSGISGYAFALSQTPTFELAEQISHLVGSANLQWRSGIWYLHARACDQAGNWGPVRTIRVNFGREK